jgi:hypothetical protein
MIERLPRRSTRDHRLTLSAGEVELTKGDITSGTALLELFDTLEP